MFVLPVLVLTACESRFSGDGAGQGIRKDSVNYYFELSKKDSLSTAERIEATEKAVRHVKNEGDSLLLKSYSQKVYLLNKTRTYDSSLAYSDTLLKYALQQQDTAYIAKAYYRKGFIHRYQGDQLAAYANLLESKKWALLLGDSTAVGRRYREMAFSQGLLGDHTGTQESAVAGLEYLNPQRDSVHLTALYNDIAEVYRMQGFYEDALREYKNALRFTQLEKEGMAELNNIALVHRDRGDFEAAFKIWEELKTRLSEARPDAQARIIDNLAYARWLQDPGADVLPEMEQALEMRLQLNDIDGLLASYRHLAEVHAAKDPALARNYAERYLQVSREASHPHSQMAALELLIGLKGAGEVRPYAQEHIRLSDSIRQAEMRVKNAFAKIRYDEERKQKTILTLETERARQQLALIEARNEEIMYLSGIVVLLLGGSFLIYYLRQRHRQEKALEAYKTETRISKKIHDELANDVYNIMTQLGEDTNPAVLDKIDHVYQRTRNISRENNSLHTGESYRDELLSMLSSYTPGSTRLICKGVDEVNWKKISADKKINLYRALQELMTNMKKHSRAGFVAVIFEERPSFLIVKYSDNGSGADAEKIFIGNGLKNTENRISDIRGSFTFETEKGRGFKAEIKIPV